MAGTLTISTLSDGTNSTSATNPIMGSAKAWVNFNGASGASPVIRASFNISSVTRTGTGLYTVSITNALADENYSVTGLGTLDGINAGYVVYQNTNGVTKTSSTFYIGTWNFAFTPADGGQVGIAVFR
jgi:hypothetical protein